MNDSIDGGYRRLGEHSLSADGILIPRWALFPIAGHSKPLLYK